jgi:Zn-dependent protease
MMNWWRGRPAGLCSHRLDLQEIMDELIFWPPTWSMLLMLPALFVGFTVHELGHALVAYLLGDTSQVERRRLTFNPLRHVSWVGLVVFLLFGFGWAKPVRVDASRFHVRNREFGFFLVSVAGASANLLTAMAIFAGMVLTIAITWTATGTSPLEAWGFLMLQEPSLDAQGVAVALSGFMVKVNLLLAFFNLLPFPPLDGFQAAMGLIAMLRKGLGREPLSGPGLAPVWGTRQATGRREEDSKLDRSETTAKSPAQIHFEIGLQYQKSGQLDEAIARYRQATAHDEHYGLAYYNLGLAYWDVGRFPLALSSFRAARKAPGMVVQVQAAQRLRELTAAEQSGLEPGVAPAPLELEVMKSQAGEGPMPLDPSVTRRVWLALAAGAVVALLLAAVAWLYVTSVTMGSLGGAGLS